MTNAPSSVRATLMGLLALAICALAFPATAQNATWRTGETLSGGQDSKLSFISSESPGVYEFQGVTLKLQTFKLSGELVIPLQLASRTASSHTLEGKGVRVKFDASNPESATIEVESTDQKNGALGVIELSVDTAATSATVLQDFSGMSFQLGDSSYYIQTFARPAFRNYDEQSIKFVAPLDPMKKVRILLSTKQQEASAAKEGAMVIPAEEKPSKELSAVTSGKAPPGPG